MRWLQRWLEPRVVPDGPLSFGFKTAWVAVKASDSRAVARALGLAGVAKCGWAAGVDRSYEEERTVFVTPALNGWVLVVGRRSIGQFEAPVNFKKLIAGLSRRFGEAQFFHSERVVDQYIWARAAGGTVLRCYASTESRTVCDEGPRSEAETGVTLSHEIPADGDFWNSPGNVVPDEDTVARIAGIWSIDPTGLESAGIAPSLGLIGMLKAGAQGISVAPVVV